MTAAAGAAGGVLAAGPLGQPETIAHCFQPPDSGSRN